MTLRHRTGRSPHLLLAGLVWASPASAADSVRLSTEVYLIDQGGTTVPLIAPAVETASTAAQLVNYCSASSHIGFEAKDTSLVFLHRDVRPTADGTINLIVTHGVDTSSPNCGSSCVLPDPNGTDATWCFKRGVGQTQGNGAVDMDIGGVPAAATLASSDDPGEFDYSGSGSLWEGRWSFGDNTDGGSIQEIPLDLAWTIQADVLAMTAGWDWKYYFADGTSLDLDPGEPLYIEYVPPPAPGVVAGVEGTAITLCGGVTDDLHPTSSVTWAWGDGASSTFTVASNTTFCRSHVYLDDAEYSVTLTAAAASPDPVRVATATADIANVPPTGQMGGPYSGDEGDTITLVASGSDVVDPLEYRWDFDGDGTFETTYAADNDVAALYPDDFEGEACVGISDGTDEVVSCTEVDVDNVPPVLTTTGPTSGEQGTAWTYAPAADDPGDDTLVWALNEAPTGMSIDASTGVVSWTPDVTHAEAENTVVVQVSDGDGGVDTEVFAIVVPGTCTDGASNQDETGLDCGGASCGRCLNGQGCEQDDDCVSLVCVQAGDVCGAPCGDGVISPTYETCDDGDDDAGDGCSASCLLEDGWLCQIGPLTTCVRDTDEDGLPDATDNCPNAANVPQDDADQDGLGDVCDPDDDQDGLDDDDEAGLTDPFDDDSDDDTIRDSDELTDPTDPENTDGDDTIDALDTDSDGDGISDAEEAGDADPGTPPIDTDDDGTPDFQDTDSDGDGVPDAQDNCRLVANPDQADLDGNGEGDACDGDMDGDGVPDGSDVCDRVADADQADRDADGVGDACEEPTPYLAGGSCALDTTGGAAAGLGLLALALVRRRR